MKKNTASDQDQRSITKPPGNNVPFKKQAYCEPLPTIRAEEKGATILLLPIGTGETK